MKSKQLIVVGVIAALIASFFIFDLGQYYRSYEELMSHWKILLQSRLITVRYEELVSDPERVLRLLLESLSLQWDSACLSHEQNVGRVDTLSLYQVRQPLNTDSTERWRHYEQHLEPLRQALAGKD